MKMTDFYSPSGSPDWSRFQESRKSLSDYVDLNFILFFYIFFVIVKTVSVLRLEEGA